MIGESAVAHLRNALAILDGGRFGNNVVCYDRPSVEAMRQRIEEAITLLNGAEKLARARADEIVERSRAVATELLADFRDMAETNRQLASGDNEPR